MAEVRIDDSAAGVTYTPPNAWEASSICDGCRGSDNVTGIEGAAWSGTWTTALATAPSSNITLSFQGTSATAYFILFTNVPGVTNVGLPVENVGRIAFYLNETRVDPSDLRFSFWWYPDFPQEAFIPDLILMAQENLGPWTHTLTIAYSIDTGRVPQVFLAFDRLEYVPVTGSTNPPTPSSSISSTPVSSLSMSSTESSGTPSSSAGTSGSGSTTNNTAKVLGISIGLSVFGVAVVAAILFWFYKGRKNRFIRDESYSIRRQTLTDTGRSPPPTSPVPFLSPYYTDQHTSSGTSGSPVTAREYEYSDATPLASSSQQPQREPNRSGSTQPYANEKSFLNLGGGGRASGERSGSRSGSSQTPPGSASSSSPATSSAPVVPLRGNEKSRLRWLTATNANEDDLISLNEVRRDGDVHRYGMASAVDGRSKTERPPSYTSEPPY